jgi:hypothetical protein
MLSSRGTSPPCPHEGILAAVKRLVDERQFTAGCKFVVLCNAISHVQLHSACSPKAGVLFVVPCTEIDTRLSVWHKTCTY